MSTLEIDGELVYRRYGDEDRLPTQWDSVGDKKATDEAVFVDGEPVAHTELPVLPPVIEGLGWTMLKAS